MPEPPALRVISPDASAEEVAAITAAFEVLQRERAQAAARASAAVTGDATRLDAWVHAARLTGRRSGMLRGPWRLSGRISRRSRA
jgi:hypothetical protein